MMQQKNATLEIMNTPTDEQIEAALKWAEYRPLAPNDCTSKHIAIINEYQHDGPPHITSAALMILAVAYREKCQELEAMKQPAQLPQHFPN